MLRLLILFTTAIMAEVGIHATIEGPPCTYPGTERPPGYQGQPGVDYYAPGTHPDCPCLPSPPGTPGTPGIQKTDVYGCPCLPRPVYTQPGSSGISPGKFLTR